MPEKTVNRANTGRVIQEKIADSLPNNWRAIYGWSGWGSAVGLGLFFVLGSLSLIGIAIAVWIFCHLV